MNNYNYIPESQPVLLTQVFPLVKTCKLPKEKAVRQKRRKLLVKPNNQPSLMDFLTKNRVNAYITSKRALDGDKTSNKKQKTSDKGNTSDTLPNNCSVNQRFALLFFLSSSPAISIKPIIILIDKTKLPTKKKEEKTYMKFRLNGHKEIGRLVALSETREALIKFVGEAISKFDKAKGKRFIKSNELVQSCLKESPFSVLDSKQIDGCLLYQMLDLQEDPCNLTPETTRNSTTIDEEPSPGTSDALNKPEKSNATGDENSNNDAEIILDPDSKEDVYVSDDQSDEIVGILSDDESATDESGSEADETEFQKGLALKDVLRPKSSTPNSQSGSGRMSKGDIYELNIKHDRKSEEERESRIQEAILRCNSLVLTLDEKASSTILLREMHGIMKDLAESLKFLKDKELSNKRVFEINKDLKVRKTNNKDELSLNGLIRFPLKAYGDAVTQPEAHRIVSWIFRKCIDEKIKEGAHMNKEHDYNHIAYKLGNARLLDFHERINDGFTVIDAIINHAHSLKSNEPYGYLSYKKCLRQIQKACYDYNNKKKVPEATKDDEDDVNSSRSYSQPMPKGAKAKQIRKDNARDELERNAALQNHDAVESYE